MFRCVSEIAGKRNACGSMTHQGRVVRGPQRWVGGPKPSHSLLMPRAGPGFGFTSEVSLLRRFRETRRRVSSTEVLTTIGVTSVELP